MVKSTMYRKQILHLGIRGSPGDKFISRKKKNCIFCIQHLSYKKTNSQKNIIKQKHVFLVTIWSYGERLYMQTALGYRPSISAKNLKALSLISLKKNTLQAKKRLREVTLLNSKSNDKTVWHCLTSTVH